MRILKRIFGLGSERVISDLGQRIFWDWLGWKPGCRRMGIVKVMRKQGNVLGLSRTVVAETQRMLGSIWEAICWWGGGTVLRRSQRCRERLKASDLEDGSQVSKDLSNGTPASSVWSLWPLMLEEARWGSPDEKCPFMLLPTPGWAVYPLLLGF